MIGSCCLLPAACCAGSGMGMGGALHCEKVTRHTGPPNAPNAGTVSGEGGEMQRPCRGCCQAETPLQARQIKEGGRVHC
ncbi:hypothetical protein BO71DRAFT_395332 [Aspergillus ellipticus CBS 707.79]|uniref:Uncharacterized protein n=1 Tax=Aspergillus ellipticus CBS 707.79 TaxID=1448320 RepID=A0A319DLW9_9EURO|nr:hypothetical protein BO71DRAFT_395332 [Aspergillus ellipticus CBS 707.79]